MRLRLIAAEPGRETQHPLNFKTLAANDPRVGASVARTTPEEVDYGEKDESEHHEHRLRQRKETAYAAPGDKLADRNECGSPDSRPAHENVAASPRSAPRMRSDLSSMIHLPTSNG